MPWPLRYVRATAAAPAVPSVPDGVKYDWTPQTIINGHLLARDSGDAIVGMGGCEPRALNLGGSVLLTRRAGRCQKVWYEPGLISDRCQRVALHNGRDLMLCETRTTRWVDEQP